MRFRFLRLLLLPLSGLARELHVVTVTQAFEVRQVPLQLSAGRWGHALHVLGLANAPQGDIWGRQLGWKLNTLHAFVRTCPEDDVVLFVDAYDVLLLDSAESILAKFAQVSKATGHTLLSAGEQSPGFRAKDYPPQRERWGYLNTGGLIGTIAAFKVLFKDPPPNYLPERYDTDQDWVIDVFFNTSGLGGIMGIDTGCVIFQVTCRVSPVLTHPGCHKDHDAVVVEGKGVRNLVTNTKPSVLHLPGPGHWAIFPSPMAALVKPWRVSCHFYEVARVLLPEMILPLEQDRAWTGSLCSVICTTRDSLVLHVLVDLGIWSATRVLFPLGGLAACLWLLTRWPRKLHHQVLGLAGAPQGDIWGRHLGWKINVLHAFVKSCPDDDVVLFIDAYDVLLLDSAESILAKFARVSEATGFSLLAAGEQSPGFRAADHPSPRERWRYLNTGGLVGTVSAFKVLFQNPPPDYLPARYMSDQDWVVDVFLNTSGLGGIMGIDTGCVIFQVTCRAIPVPTSPLCSKDFDAVLVEGNRVRNNVTGTRPSVLHFSGPGHYPIFPTLMEKLRTPAARTATCGYYEVARVLQPEVILPLESDIAWNGKLHSLVCSGGSLVWHFVVDSHLWSLCRVAVPLGALMVSLWLCRWCGLCGRRQMPRVQIQTAEDKAV